MIPSATASTVVLRRTALNTRFPGLLALLAADADTDAGTDAADRGSADTQP